MGCVQSKPSKNRRSNRKRRRSKSKRRTGESKQQQILSPSNNVSETNNEQKVEDLGSEKLPEEKQMISHQNIPEETQVINQQKTICEKSPSKGTSELQPNTESVVNDNDKGGNTESVVNDNDKGGPVKNNMSNIPQMPESDNSPATKATVPANLISGVGSPVRSANIPRNSSSSTYSSTNSENDRNAPPPFPSTNSPKNINSAKNPSFPYEGFPPPRRESEVSYKYDDAAKHDDLRREEPKDVFRPEKSKGYSSEDIGSICIDARTGEYKFYQSGVLVGYVEKAEAEKISKNWPICPGTDAKAENDGRFQRDVSSNLRNKVNREMSDFPTRPNVYQDPNVNQIDSSKQTFQPIAGYRKNDKSYFDQPNRGHAVAQPLLRHRGYDM